MLDFSKFEYLTFDCYGTLVDWEAGLLPVLRSVVQNHGKSIDDAGLLELYGELEAEAEQPPFRNYREVLKSVVSGLGQKLGFTPSTMEEDSLPESLRYWRPWSDTVDALNKLGARFKLAIISNIDDDLFAATGRRLQVRFDHVITAEQARCYKPGKDIFRLALQKIGIPAERVLHVGQSIYHDVIPAQSFGMKAVWVNRPSARANVGAVKKAAGAPDLEISNLAALADAVLAHPAQSTR